MRKDYTKTLLKVNMIPVEKVAIASNTQCLVFVSIFSCKYFFSVFASPVLFQFCIFFGKGNSVLTLSKTYSTRGFFKKLK